jgi:hypothetical protein
VINDNLRWRTVGEIFFSFYKKNNGNLGWGTVGVALIEIYMVDFYSGFLLPPISSTSYIVTIVFLNNYSIISHKHSLFHSI